MSAPVRHTCPDIDKVIKQIKTAIKYAEDGCNCAEKSTDEYYYFDCIKDELWRLDDTLEELRSSNDALRTWGHDLEKQVADLEDDKYMLEEQIKETQFTTACTS